jgi:hypothetical protein
MSTPVKSIPDLEALRKAVQQYQPNPHRIPFKDLKTVHDFIVELRNRTISYAGITELLQQHGIKTSRARVAEYGRIVLDGGKSRKRRKRAHTMPPVNTLVTPQSPPAVTVKPTPVTAAPASNVPPPAKENFAYTSRATHC